jgi:hypothetical protein
MLQRFLAEAPRKPMEAAAWKALFAELVGLRTILLNLFFKLASGERTTTEEMRTNDRAVEAPTREAVNDSTRLYTRGLLRRIQEIERAGPPRISPWFPPVQFGSNLVANWAVYAGFNRLVRLITPLNSVTAQG